ncbi:hypothetical protein C5167_029431 [Papaver somniferum]|nr:hypothetical protein C5167_029431 [Papaver somniferum]
MFATRNEGRTGLDKRRGRYITNESEFHGRTAKRLAKWWEVFKEKQQREQKESSSSLKPIEEGKYDRILETFTQRLVSQHQAPQFVMTTASNGAFLHSAPPTPPTPTLLPPWLSTSNGLPTNTRPPSTVDLVPTFPWLHPERGLNNCSLPPSNGRDNQIISELEEYCRELEEGHRVWEEHKKEAEWRVRRMGLQLESEKTDAEAKEQKLAEQRFAKHMHLILTKFLDQRSCVSSPNEPNF